MTLHKVGALAVFGSRGFLRFHFSEELFVKLRALSNCSTWTNPSLFSVVGYNSNDRMSRGLIVLPVGQLDRAQRWRHRCSNLGSGQYLSRPYLPRPRKYRWLFSEPTYWPRRSRGQYGEENNQAGIFEAKGNKSLIPAREARSPQSLYSKSPKGKLGDCPACKRSAGTGSRWRSPKWFHRFFPPTFVNSQIAQVNSIDWRCLCEWSPVQVRFTPKSLLGQTKKGLCFD